MVVGQSCPWRSGATAPHKKPDAKENALAFKASLDSLPFVRLWYSLLPLALLKAARPLALLQNQGVVWVFCGWRCFHVELPSHPQCPPLVSCTCTSLRQRALSSHALGVEGGGWLEGHFPRKQVWAFLPADPHPVRPSICLPAVAHLPWPASPSRTEAGLLLVDMSPCHSLSAAPLRFQVPAPLRLPPDS